MTLLRITYYAGAFLIILSMSAFMISRWELLSSTAITWIAFSYAVLLFTSGYLLWKKSCFKTPAGLLVTASVCTTPLIVWGVQQGIGKPLSHDLWIALATMLVSVIALRFVSFAFLMVPICIAGLFASLELMPCLLQQEEVLWWQDEGLCVLFSLGLLGVSYCMEKKGRKDLAFWGYLLGTITLWWEVTMLTMQSHLPKLLYCSICMAMIASALVIKRVILLICGALGLLGYVGYLAYDVFGDSGLFPFVVSLIGALMIAIALIYQKRRKLS